MTHVGFLQHFLYILVIFESKLSNMVTLKVFPSFFKLFQAFSSFSVAMASVSAPSQDVCE